MTQQPNAGYSMSDDEKLTAALERAQKAEAAICEIQIYLKEFEWECDDAGVRQCCPECFVKFGEKHESDCKMLKALSFNVGQDLRAKLKVAREALKNIAGQDYRGNRSVDSRTAGDALAAIDEKGNL